MHAPAMDAVSFRHLLHGLIVFMAGGKGHCTYQDTGHFAIRVLSMMSPLDTFNTRIVLLKDDI